MQINVSAQDFRKIYGEGYLYVDKTRFLIDWWKKGSDVTLMTRPRRFGKSLLLSTVKYFFDPAYRDGVKATDGTPLFESLDVWKDEEMRAVHGTVPVIHMTLSGVKNGLPEETLFELNDQVQSAYTDHIQILESKKLYDQEKTSYLNYASGLLPRDQTDPASEMIRLCQYLERVYGKKPVLLMDEYDTPLTEAFTGNTFSSVTDVMRKFLVKTFKDNDHFSKCLITGITRIAQQSLFSNFNNPKIDTMLDAAYPTALGYTREDVDNLLKAAGMEDKCQQVRAMYEGYTMGEEIEIYNPYSVNCFLDTRRFLSFWILSSENALARQVIRNGVTEIQENVMTLLQGGSIITELPTNLVYSSLYSTPASAFSLLFSAGFLKLKQKIRLNPGAVPEEYAYEVAIPNGEVTDFFRDVCLKWFGENSTDENSAVRRFQRALLAADMDQMTQCLSELALSCIGEQDVADNPKHPPENFYHGLVLGMVVSLDGIYKVISNGNSGLGRFDIQMIPKFDNPRYLNGELLAFNIEFKVKDKDESSLIHTVRRAVQQIQDRKYTQNLLSLGIPEERIKCFGIAFDGKKVLVGDGTEPLPAGKKSRGKEKAKDILPDTDED